MYIDHPIQRLTVAFFAFEFLFAKLCAVLEARLCAFCQRNENDQKRLRNPVNSIKAQASLVPAASANAKKALSRVEITTQTTPEFTRSAEAAISFPSAPNTVGIYQSLS